MKESKPDRDLRQAAELATFVEVLRRAGNILETEVRFMPSRKWRIDIVLPVKKIALEIEGRGRHVSFAGWEADRHKYNAITIAGLRLLRTTRDEIGNGDALELLAQAGVKVTA